MLHDILHRHGLSTKEAKAYTAGLELGPSPASKIARNIGESRVNSYAICQNLVRKNVAHMMKKNNVTHFSMISPQHFLKNIESKVADFMAIIPELDLLASKNINKPRVRYFEGLSGLKRMFDIILHNTDTIEGFLGASAMSPGFKAYMDNEFIPQRIAKGIPIKVISSNSEADIYYKKTEKESLREVRVIDEKIFDLAGEILLFGEDKVAIGMFGQHEMMGVIIESKHFFNSQMSLFTIIWGLTANSNNKKNSQQQKPS